MKSGNNARELSVEELGLRWEWLIETGFNKLEVTEQFPKRGQNKFIVTDLTLECENEYVFCSDKGELLIKHYSPLMIFLRSGLTSIHLLPLGNNLYQERLIFGSNGIILIEKAS